MPKEVNTRILEESETVRADEVGKAVLREFMHSKKFKKTLATFDEEVPRDEITVASRQLVSDMLGLHSLVEANKVSDDKWKTLLEVMCANRVGREEGDVDSDDPDAIQKVVLEKLAERDSLLDEVGKKTKALKKLKKQEKEAKAAGKKKHKQQHPSIDDILDAAGGGGRKKKKGDEKKKKSKKNKDATRTADNDTQQPSGAKDDDELKQFYKELEDEAEAKMSKQHDNSETDSESEADNISGEESDTSPRTDQGPKQAGWGMTDMEPEEVTATEAAAAVPSIMDLVPSVQGRPISSDAAKKLKEALCGPIRLPDPWIQQGFFFNDAIKYGLVQNMGGPCGLLAVVQARVISHLLFEKGLQRDGITEADQRDALIHALTKTLITISEGGTVLLCLPWDVGMAVGVVHDRVSLDSWRVHTVGRSLEEVMRAVGQYLAFFMERRGLGLLSFMVSAVYTRGGADAVVSDMDGRMGGEGALIVCHQYSSQELVSLLIFGKAYGNVFDGERNIGGMLLRGTPHPTDIGLLTYQEYTRDVEVGTHLKNPTYPIWTIWNESHYCTCFAAPENSSPTTVDLYYYDQLGAQDEEYQLTVNTAETYVEPPPGADMPYMDDILRTRKEWATATVSWNGSDPLL